MSASLTILRSAWTLPPSRGPRGVNPQVPQSASSLVLQSAASPSSPWLLRWWLWSCAAAAHRRAASLCPAPLCLTNRRPPRRPSCSSRMTAISFMAFLRRNDGYPQVGLCCCETSTSPPAVSFSYVCAMDGCSSTDWAPVWTSAYVVAAAWGGRAVLRSHPTQSLSCPLYVEHLVLVVLLVCVSVARKPRCLSLAVDWPGTQTRRKCNGFEEGPGDRDSEETVTVQVQVADSSPTQAQALSLRVGPP